MTDRTPTKPGQYKAVVTAEEVEKLQNGEQFIITLVRDDQPDATGTPYNKASVLPDELAAIICPGISDPTPADALAALLPINGSKAMSANLNMAGYSVKKLATPTDGADAVPKSYADTLAAAHNLLDNSNFTNPVNQRGEAVYDSAGYTIDRWFCPSAMAPEVSTADDAITISAAGFAGAFSQNVGKRLDGKTVTFAVCWGDGAISVASGTIPEDDVTDLKSVKSVSVYDPDSTAVTAMFKIILYKTEEQLPQVRISVQKGYTVSFKWAALYEGEYTAEGLPRYVPKGYGAELMECMRYYQIRSTNDVAAVDMRPLMVSDAPEITEVTNGYAYSADL